MACPGGSRRRHPDVAQPDPRESDLTASTEEERAHVAQVLPMQYQNDREPILAESL